VHIGDRPVSDRHSIPQPLRHESGAAQSAPHDLETEMAPRLQSSLNKNTTEPSSATSSAALNKPTYAFLRDRDAAQEEQNGMESAAESKASDEGSSPAAVEEHQPPQPPGPPALPPPVDGGLVCWLQVVGAFGTWTNVSGNVCNIVLHCC
jgi:hypothetical protein